MTEDCFHNESKFQLWSIGYQLFIHCFFTASHEFKAILKLKDDSLFPRAGLRLPGAPRLRVVLVPLPIQYMAVFNIFHASHGAH